MFALPMILFSCDTDDLDPVGVKTWNLVLSAKNEIPAPDSRAETGTAMLQLMADNSLKYEISVSSLATGDALTMSHLHVGNAGSNGGVVQLLTSSFTGTSASGTVTNLRQSLVDSLKSDDNEIYINVHSQQVGSGLVRAQLNTNVELAMDVALSSANEVTTTPVTPIATGKAILRLTSDKELFSNVTVTGLDPVDALTFAHIHSGASNANGPVLIPLCASAADFGVTRMPPLSDENYAKLKTDALYVNAHSTKYASGVARGQIR